MSSLVIGPRLTETISVRKVSGHSAGGDPSRAPAVTMRARIQRTAGTGSPPTQGLDDTEGHLVFTDTELEVGDLVFFPEDDAADINTGHRVRQVVRHVALDGTTTHWTAKL